MAEETKKTTIRRNNYVDITGYLKENTLECVKTKDGKDAIRGNLIVATSDTEAYKVQFYANHFKKDGNENSTYKNLLEVLPSRAMSIAAYLSGNPAANFQTAAQCSTKVHVRAHMQEYATKLDNKERSIVTLKGFSVELKTATDAHPFVPEAKFDVDMYIESMSEETKYDKETENVEPTGRLIISGLLPEDYDGTMRTMNRISFVVPAEKADFVQNNYEVHDTANFKGKLVNIEQKEVASETVDDPFAWNGGGETQFKTTFVRERQILGRNPGKLPIHEGDENCITQEEVKAGLVLRDQHIAENTTRRNTSGGNRRASAGMAANTLDSVTAPTVGTEDPFGGNFDDFNF